MASAELLPQAIKLDKLIARIETGDIKIPAFQRGFVWDEEQILELLDSLYRNYPVGSALLWSSNEKLKAARNVAGFAIPERADEYPVNYVLDGQQRLSTIYGVFCRDRKPAAEDSVYKVDHSVFEISFDFQRSIFIPRTDVKDPKRTLPLAYLFATDKLFPAMESLEPGDRKLAQDLYSRFSNYELSVVTISKRGKDEVGTIFERINSTGTALTTLDLMVAWTWSEEFHLQDEINQLLDTLNSKNFGELSDRVVLQSLGALLSQSTTTKTILSLAPEKVRDSFPTLVASLELAIDALSTQFRVSSLEFLPHQQQLVALSYFYSRIPAPSVEQLAVLRKWFWMTSFSKRYSAQTDDKMDEDIALFADLAEGKPVTLERYGYSVDAKTLVRQQFTKGSPLVRATLLLLANRGPMDLTNGAAVDVGTALASYNRKEYHHVFPRAHLKKKNVSAEKANSTCNFCFLPALSNKKISSKAPSDYFFTVVPDGARKAILEANLLPLKMDIYKADDLDTFLEQRAQAVIQYLDSLLV